MYYVFHCQMKIKKIQKKIHCCIVPIQFKIQTRKSVSARYLKRFAFRQHDWLYRAIQREGMGVYSRQIFRILKLTFVVLFL